MNTRHGFLTNFIDPADGFVSELSCTLHCEGKQEDCLFRPESPERLIEFALQHRLTHLWIMPEYKGELTEERARMRGVCPGQDDYEFRSYTPEQQDYIASIEGRRLNPAVSPEVTISWLSQSTWGLEPDIEKLASAFAEIESTLGIPMQSHPGVMGLDYLRKVDEKNYYRYFALPKDIAWQMIRSVSVSAIAEFKPVTGEALDKKYLYCYDRNSSQPYAASQIKAGVGQPVIRRQIEFDHLVPGFWACQIEGLDQLWQGLPLLPSNRDWLPTPLVKMAQQMGCKIHVEEAYIWPDKKDRAPIFQRWAHNLWALREQYAPGTPERAAIKSIMNKTIGLLRRKKAEGKGFRDYRPDWYSLILAEERAVVWWKAQNVYAQTGIKPVGAYHDALYYCADDEISALTTHKTGKDLRNSLGGYKIDWILPMCDEVKAILSAAQPRSAADRIGLLKKWGREHGHI